MLSKTSISLEFSKKFKPFQLNLVTNLEKKRDFCDRVDFEYTINDSGKQITVNLNTVMYEALKNNAIFLFFSFGSVSLVYNSVFSDDLDNANVETQHYLHLNDDNYNVTATFYHTSCNIFITPAAI